MAESRKFCAIVVMLALLPLAGQACASRTAKGAAIGAAGGAAAGAIIGKVAGSTAKGAIIGAAVGGAILKPKSGSDRLAVCSIGGETERP